MASAALSKRIQKEISRLASEPVEGIDAKPFEDNLRYFDVTIEGPSDSPYSGGVFKLELYLPADYPMVAPKVRFLTRLYHPNVDKLGRICLDILKTKWSPALQIRTVLLSIQALMSCPNPGDPLDPKMILFVFAAPLSLMYLYHRIDYIQIKFVFDASLSWMYDPIYLETQKVLFDASVPSTYHRIDWVPIVSMHLFHWCIILLV